MKEQLPIILASSSPRRQELLRELGLSFDIRASGADETVEPGMAPAAIVESLAVRKAAHVRDELREEGRREGLVIGSDTIVVLDGQVLGKPEDAADACRMLTMLQGRTHQVYTGVAVLDLASERRMAEHSVSRVTFRTMSDEEIRAYVKTGEPLDKAGSYGVQSVGAVFIEKIEGDFYSIMGLPLNLLYQMLLSCGISPFE